VPTEEASARTLLIIVSVIGAIFTIVMIILFFNAAPARSDIPDHQTYTDPAACLKCHLRGTEQSPTMPHLNVGSCHICHQLEKEKKPK
jgi:cytochrome c553